jgi:hypothetical protein
LKTIKTSCGWNGWGHEIDDTELGYMKQAIKDESSASHVPKELILAVIMQESKGCVRAHTTNDGANPGLMQSAGTASCNNGSPIYPCPKSTIVAMIHQGTAGADLPTTLKNSLDEFSNADDSKYYKAARRYTSGEKYTDSNLAVSVTPCYASDISNRLVQPGVECKCNSQTVVQLTKSKGITGSLPLQQSQVSNGQGQNNAPVDDNNDIPNSDTGPSGKDITGAVDNCTKFFVPTEGNSCEKAGVDFGKLQKLNKNLNDNCSNMWAGYKYCVAT